MVVPTVHTGTATRFSAAIALPHHRCIRSTLQSSAADVKGLTPEETRLVSRVILSGMEACSLYWETEVRPDPQGVYYRLADMLSGQFCALVYHRLADMLSPQPCENLFAAAVPHGRAVGAQPPKPHFSLDHWIIFVSCAVLERQELHMCLVPHMGAFVQLLTKSDHLLHIVVHLLMSDSSNTAQAFTDALAGFLINEKMDVRAMSRNA